MEEKAITLKELTQDKAGAIRVIGQLVMHIGSFVEFDMELLMRMNIVGMDIYYLYVCCNEDIAEFHAALMRNTALRILKSYPQSSFYTQPTQDKQ